MPISENLAHKRYVFVTLCLVKLLTFWPERPSILPHLVSGFQQTCIAKQDISETSFHGVFNEHTVLPFGHVFVPTAFQMAVHQALVTPMAVTLFTLLALLSNEANTSRKVCLGLASAGKHIQSL